MCCRCRGRTHQDLATIDLSPKPGFGPYIKQPDCSTARGIKTKKSTGVAHTSGKSFGHKTKDLLYCYSECLHRHRGGILWQLGISAASSKCLWIHTTTNNSVPVTTLKSNAQPMRLSIHVLGAHVLLCFTRIHTPWILRAPPTPGLR